MVDPRVYQIAVLASLLVYGMARLALDITVVRACLILLTAIVTQAACDRLTRRPSNIRSALISGLSLCLLLRTNYTSLAIAAAVVAIASKFLIRVRGKHLFNPTNGGIVVNRASRSDVTYAFIVSYCTLLLGRSFYLGEPWAIPLHRLQSGATLLFTFFMISDPKTTPDSRAGRVLFAALVAFGGWYVQFQLFRTNGLLWSLAAFALAVPLIDRLLPGTRYSWMSYKEQPHDEKSRILRGDRIGTGLVGGAAPQLLRLLRREGRHEAVQQGIAGGAGS